MKKILLAAMAMLFAMNMTAQNTQTISQEIRNSFRNGKPVFSKEIQAMDKAMHEGKAGEVFGEMYLTDLASSSECSVDRISIVSLSNVTSSSAKAVVKIVENCPDENNSYQYNMDLIKENGKWVIDNYEQMKEHVLKTFREHGIKWNSGQSANTRVLTDLISFKDILDTNGNMGSLARTHGFKSKTIGRMTFIYKNCDIDGYANVSPYGKGTSICIIQDANVNGKSFSISVYNDNAFNQLKTDFLNYASEVRGEDYKYVLKWSNGHAIRASVGKDEKGGYILIKEPWEN